MHGFLNRLTTRFTLLILPIALLPLLFIAVLGLNISSQSLVEQINKNNLASAQHGSLLAKNATFSLEQALKLVIETLDFQQQSIEDMEWSLASLRTFFPEIQSQSIVDAAARELLVFDRDRVTSPNQFRDLSQNKVFTEAMRGKTSLGTVYIAADGTRRVEMGLPIFDLQTGTIGQVIITVISLRNLFSEVSMNKVGTTGSILVFDRDGKLIAHTDRNRVFDRQKLESNPYQQEFSEGRKISPPYRYVNHDGIEVLGAAYSTSFPEWIVVSELPVDEAMAPINRQMRLILFCLAAIAILACAATLIVSRSLSRPLRLLEAGAAQIASGKLDVSIPVKSHDEIGSVSKAFNSMAVKLSVAADEKAESEWLMNGRLGFNNAIREAGDLKSLAALVITFLADYLEARVGVIFVEDGEKTFTCFAGYALNADPDKVPRFKLGEGLVGQAAESKKTCIIQTPEDYLRVVSGLGDTVVDHLLIVPMLYRKEQVTGVVELGFFGTTPSRASEFLALIGESISIEIISLRAQEERQATLERTRQLAEELQTQSEELRVANEELEEQTQKLQSSEEELRVSNEELEVRSREVRFANEDINKQNLALQKAQKVLEENTRQLELSSKYKSEFLANMSHELRTPLNSLLILSQDLASNRSSNLSEEQVEAADIINHSGHDLLRLINDILDISKIEAGKVLLQVERCSPADIMWEIDTTFRQQVENKGLSLSLKIEDGLPDEMLTDQLRLVQIIRNLVANSVKFTEQGEILIRCYKPEPDTILKKTGLTPENSLAFTVTDTGIGIPADRLETIFEAFQQVDGSISRRYGGTGLGLTISRELAKLLGGEINVQSREGEGSSFTLYLPEKIDGSTETLSQDVTAPPLPARPPASPPRIPSPRIRDDEKDIKPDDLVILVIEDDPVFAKIVCDYSHKKGFKCLHAGDGETGLDLVEKFAPAALILDIHLPGISGYTVLDCIKKDSKTRDIPVHIISGDDQDLEACAGGIIGYQKKPVQPDDLERTFENIGSILSQQFRKLLVVEDDRAQSKAICTLLGNKNINISTVYNGKDALDLLEKETFDCIILDINLPDMSGYRLLEVMQERKRNIPPLVVYTASEISRPDEERLRQFNSTIIIKGKVSPERLLDETALFLHRVFEDLPKEKQQKISAGQYQPDEILAERSVLLVDDDMRNVFALAKILSDRGMKVHKASDGSKCLDILAREKKIDIVLMDIMMPVMDGYTAIEKIRTSGAPYKDIPIIAVTAKAMVDDYEKCMKVGASDYLAKPVDIDRLLSMIKNFLA